jgi:hypothetical protein
VGSDLTKAIGQCVAIKPYFKASFDGKRPEASPSLRSAVIVSANVGSASL